MSAVHLSSTGTQPLETDKKTSLSAIDRLTRRDWLIVLIPAVVLRAVVLLSGTVSFNSDEAIVALMARHIVQGQPIPVFFYGQAYLGSLDAILVSVGFRLFGEQVASIRLVESIIYVLIVITTVLLAYRLSHRRRAAVIAGLLIAIPPVMFTLYTSMTLGGYGETLLIGNLIWLIGWDLYDRPDGSRWRWILLGLLAGLGWWTDALIIDYAIPIGLFLLIGVIRRHHWRDLIWIGLAVLCFVIGGLPWWIDNMIHQWEGLKWLLNNSQSQGFGQLFDLNTRLIGLFFLDFPAALGVRYSWTPEGWAGALGGVIGAIAIVIGVITVRRAIRQNGPERFLLVSVISLSILVLISSSGIDASGRYFLPVVIMYILLFVLAVDSLLQVPRFAPLPIAIVAGVVAFQLIGHIVALRTVPPGLTSQFDAVTDFTNDADQQAIAFLESHNGTLGYGTYWVTFRLAFLSQENVILDAWLPYKGSLSYTPADRRYPPYTQLVEAAATPVYVTANTPELNTALRQSFAKFNIRYHEQMIGPYLIFYDLSKKITPDQLELGLPGVSP